MPDSRNIEFMSRALELAARAAGRTSPNPMVGAVIVRDGTVVAEGYHEKAGADHAEIVALKRAGGNTRGATMYVTLEPCAHHGKTPPCVEAIIGAGIGRVVAAQVDPHKLVAGKGIERLTEAGIEVEVGVLEARARRLNEAHIKFSETGLPFVYLKYAMSLDGKVATRTGDARWITGEAARRRVHELRDRVDAIMVGSGTVRTDDPELTTRLPEHDGMDPVRVVLNTGATLDPQTRIFNTDSQAPTWLVVGEDCPEENMQRFNSTTTEIVRCPVDESRLDLRAVLKLLGERGIRSVLLEGGPTVNSAALEQGLVDKLLCFVAPILVGGNDAPGPVGGTGIERMADALRLADEEIETVGTDVLIQGYLDQCLQV